jgi:UDP-N-acetylmuramoyl-tripeptide--D-alanyl-D-alanine ligase
LGFSLLSALTLGDVAAATTGTLVPTTARGSAPEASADGRALAGVSIDSRTIRPGELFVAVVGKRFDGHDFVKEAAARGAAAVLVQREVTSPADLPLLRVADTTRALADLARFRRRQTGIPVVAITGSYGKTTTKDLTAAILETRGPVLKTEGNLNNQYGLPLSLLRLGPEHTAVVVELGMSAFGELRQLSRIAEPDLGVITNVGSAHLEFFGSVDEVAKAKAEILEGLREGGRAVLNGDDPRVRRIGEAFPGPVLWFGRDRRYDVSGENWRGTAFGGRFDLVIGGEKFDVALPLPGPHFMSNFLAAAAVGHALGLAPREMAGAVASFSPGPHRSQVRRLGGGVVLIDDCYNSSPEALDAAVSALSLTGGRRRVAVLGDMLELGAAAKAIHREHGAAYVGKLELLAAVGALGREIAEGACRAGLPTGAVHLFEDAAAAAAALPRLVEPGDAVLVKASRGVKLEQVVDALVQHLGEERA